ncbi:hypothetical protein BJY04DRAFT_20817 [Aspergillus karnatakaensis]|uniref:uncharacterized protein n=1 Tax=Aspergillus karnatakaensis TaxID=1810916 RepID=UPI003CCE2CBD
MCGYGKDNISNYRRRENDGRIVITIVLDCCFSASVYRQDEVRYHPYHPSFRSNITAKRGRKYRLGTRDESIRDNWLLNPKDYAILVACGPHEEAKEVICRDNQQHGALSCFVLSTLRKRGLRVRLEEMLQLVAVNFRELRIPKQVPVVYGNKRQAFFQHSDMGDKPTPIAVTKHSEGWILCAGGAHGFCVGDSLDTIVQTSVGRSRSSQGHAFSATIVRLGLLHLFLSYRE